MNLRRCIIPLLLLTTVVAAGCGKEPQPKVEASPELGIDLLKGSITEVRKDTENQMYEVKEDVDNLTGIEGVYGVYSKSDNDSDAYLIMICRLNDSNKEDLKHWTEVYCQNRKDVTEVVDEDDFKVAQEAIVGEVEDYLLLVMHPDSKTLYSNIEDKLLVHIENLRHSNDAEQV